MLYASAPDEAAEVNREDHMSAVSSRSAVEPHEKPGCQVRDCRDDEDVIMWQDDV